MSGPPGDDWIRIDPFAPDWEAQCDLEIDAAAEAYVDWLRACVLELIADGTMKAYTDHEVEEWLTSQEARHRQWLTAHYAEQTALMRKAHTH